MVVGVVDKSGWDEDDVVRRGRRRREGGKRGAWICSGTWESFGSFLMGPREITNQTGCSTTHHHQARIAPA